VNKNQANIKAKKIWGPDAYAKRFKISGNSFYTYFAGRKEGGVLGHSYEECFKIADKNGNCPTKF